MAKSPRANCGKTSNSSWVHNDCAPYPQDRTGSPGQVLPLDQGRLPLGEFLDRGHTQFPHRAFPLDQSLALQNSLGMDGVVIKFLKSLLPPPIPPVKLMEITIEAIRNSDGGKAATITWTVDRVAAHADLVHKLASLYPLGVYDHTFTVSCKKV